MDYFDSPLDDGPFRARGNHECLFDLLHTHVTAPQQQTLLFIRFDISSNLELDRLKLSLWLLFGARRLACTAALHYISQIIISKSNINR